jgi:hypothetical protein
MKVKKTPKAPKELKAPKEPKAKKEKVLKFSEPIAPAVVEEDIDAKILRLVNQHFSSIKPPKPEPDDIIVVKKKVKRAPPRKKTIYIEEEDSVDELVSHAHPQAVPMIQYW